MKKAHVNRYFHHVSMLLVRGKKSGRYYFWLLMVRKGKILETWNQHLNDETLTSYLCPT
jgi:hypothetical protein